MALVLRLHQAVVATAKTAFFAVARQTVAIPLRRGLTGEPWVPPCLLGEVSEALLGHAADLREVAAGGEPRAGAGQREDAERAVRVRVPRGERARALVDREQLEPLDRRRARVLAALR